MGGEISAWINGSIDNCQEMDEWINRTDAKMDKIGSIGGWMDGWA